MTCVNRRYPTLATMWSVILTTLQPLQRGSDSHRQVQEPASKNGYADPRRRSLHKQVITWY